MSFHFSIFILWSVYELIFTVKMPDSDSSIFLLKSAGFLGSSGIALGAFGAHALKDKLELRSPSGLENWKTAVMYQLFHASALLALSSLSNHKKSLTSSLERSGKMMLVGSVVFSGSIYCLCLDIGPRKLMGPITPIGGLFMIGGWLTLAFA